MIVSCGAGPATLVRTSQASHSAFLPGENHHHGIEVNGSICQPVEQELFICQVDEGGGVSLREGVGGGVTLRGGGGVWQEVRGVQRSLTDNPFLVLYQLGLHHSGKLLQSLYHLKRDKSHGAEEAGSPCHRLCPKDYSPVHRCDLTLGEQPPRDSNHCPSLSAWKTAQE